MKRFMYQHEGFFERPVAFFDLDGTVRHPTSGEFINAANQQHIPDEVANKISLLSAQGFMIVGMTNQAGVAYGHISYSEMVRGVHATAAMAWLDVCLYSPFHPDGNTPPFNRKTFLRKPSTGMFALAEGVLMKENVIIDWDRSFMVGDREEDQQCASNGDVQFYWAEDFFSDAVRIFSVIDPEGRGVLSFVLDTRNASPKDLASRAADMFDMPPANYLLINADNGLPVSELDAEYYHLANAAAYAN